MVSDYDDYDDDDACESNYHAPSKSKEPGLLMGKNPRTFW